MCVFLLPCNPPPPPQSTYAYTHYDTHMQQLEQGFHFLLEHNSFTKSLLNFLLQILNLLLYVS
jgi:hypothetical protein